MIISQDELGQDTVAVRLSGRVTLGQATETIVAVVEGLLGAGKRNVIFDLTEVTAIDSTGIGRFIASYGKIRAAGGEMRMAGATGHLADVFHVTRLDTVFRFYATISDATNH